MEKLDIHMWKNKTRFLLFLKYKKQHKVDQTFKLRPEAKKLLEGNIREAFQYIDVGNDFR
jgi:hypothetical protein